MVLERSVVKESSVSVGAQLGAWLSEVMAATVVGSELWLWWLPRELQAIPRPSQTACLAGWLTLAGTQVQREINPATRKWLSIRWCAGRFSLWWTGSRQSSNLPNRWDCCLERRDLAVGAFVVNVWGFVPAKPTPLRAGL